MTDSQYYTPELEDLFIGYECEIVTDSFLDGFSWEKYKITKDYLYYHDKVTSIKTPYLSKEDIESEGWELDSKIEEKEFYEVFGKSSFRYLKVINNRLYEILYSESHHLYLKVESADGLEYTYLYNGECKSINEFRKICKWLNIK